MTQKRIDFFGSFQASGVDPSAANRMRALAGVAEQVSGIALQEGKRVAIEQGAAEGRQSVQRDEEGNVIAPELRGSYTFRDQSFNEAAILAHRAEVKRDTKETLNRLQNDYEMDPDGFRQVAAKYKEGVLKGMPEELKFVLSEDIENDIVTRGVQLDDKAHQFRKQKAIAATVDMASDLRDEILNAVRSGNEEAASRYRAERLALMQRGVNSGLVDPVQAAQDAEKMKEAIVINGEIGRIERLFSDNSLGIEEKIVEGTAIVDAQKNKIYKDLTPDQRDAVNDALSAKLNEVIRLESEMNAQAQKELAQETIDLKLDAQYGRRDPAEIQAKAFDMFQDQQITEGEYQGILNSLANQEAQKTQYALIDTKVARRLSGDESIALDQKEVDIFFDRNVVPLMGQMDPTERAAYAVNFSRFTGLIPSSVKRQITNNLRSEDQELIMEAAEVIDGIDNIRGLESPVKPHDRAFAQLVTDLTQVMQPAEALKLAREQSDPQNTSRIEARERIIKDEKYQEEYQDNALGIFKGITDFGDVKGIDALNTGQLEKEYQTIFETHFKAGMDESAAREKAEQLLSKNWAFSESSGRIMKHPPEQFYAVQGETDYIKTQLDSWVRKRTSYGLTLEGYQSAMLVADEETGKLASVGKPDYLVYVQDANGMLDILTGVDPSDGKVKPIRWAPDPDIEAKRIREMNEKDAMEMRQKNQLKRSLPNMPLQGGFG